MKVKSLSGESSIKKKNTVLKWNFAMGILHGTFFSGGRAFGNPDTILPVFLSYFSASKILVGLSSSIFGSLGGIATILPQMFVASRLENKVYKRPVLRIAITIRAVCWGLLSLVTYFCAISHPNITVFSLFFSLFLFTFMGGVATIPFMDIWGKTIPSTLRGRFFGHRQFWGGIFAVGSGYIASLVLGSKNLHFPGNYALLFLFAFIFIGISYLALGSVKEPVEETYKNHLTLREFLNKAFKILRFDKNYRKFLSVQILAGASSLALPFYVLYAKDILKVKLGMVGTFLLAQMVGNVLSNLLWAHLSDFVSNRRVIQVSTFFGLLVPLIAIITPSHLPVLFIPLFALTGFFIAGNIIGKTNFLLDIAPPKDRLAYISLNGTLTFPILIFPLIGGTIIQYISYNFLFILTLLILLVGFMLSLKLNDPRESELNMEEYSK